MDAGTETVDPNTWTFSEMDNAPYADGATDAAATSTDYNLNGAHETTEFPNRTPDQKVPHLNGENGNNFPYGKFTPFQAPPIDDSFYDFQTLDAFNGYSSPAEVGFPYANASQMDNYLSYPVAAGMGGFAPPPMGRNSAQAMGYPPQVGPVPPNRMPNPTGQFNAPNPLTAMYPHYINNWPNGGYPMEALQEQMFYGADFSCMTNLGNYRMEQFENTTNAKVQASKGASNATLPYSTESDYLGDSRKMGDMFAEPNDMELFATESPQNAKSN